ncbi:MAG: Crp/Fnr family transcriptional regulator [Bacteroidota bacterium]
MELNTFLKSKRLFTNEECNSIEASFRSEIIHKGDVIREVNRFANSVLFIESGLLRIFYLQNGKDITHFFFDENHFIAPIYSILYNKTERYQWEALEACQVRVIPYDDFLTLEDRFPKLSRLIIEFMMYLLDMFSQKLNVLQFQSASDKYELYLDMYPNLTNRVALGSVASFLGITQQTLSVVRAKKNK